MGGAEFAQGAARLAGLAGLLLAWSPDAFWRATPAELRSALEALWGSDVGGVGRDELTRLMEMFPD